MEVAAPAPGGSVNAGADRGPVGERAPLVEVDGLAVRFHRKGDGGLVYAVRGVSFEIRRDTTLVLVGESGSGKSVTARAIVGLNTGAGTEVTGAIRYGGRNLLELSNAAWQQVRGLEIGIVFQDPMRSLNPTMRIGTQIGEGIRKHFGIGQKEARERAVELLDMVGIPSARTRVREYPHQLSGGMRQRVMIAIAISCRPAVLLADEPTTALDVTTEAQIMELLRDLQRELHMGVLLITHDMGLAFAYGDEIAVMYGGRIVERGQVEAMERRVRMPYTKALLDSVPVLADEPHTPFIAMGGRPPDPTVLIPGCAYAPRCSRAQERCHAGRPPLEKVGDREFACWYPLEG